MEKPSVTQRPMVLLKAMDVAQIMQISRTMAYGLIQDGSIPSIRFKHTVRVRPQDLDAFIQKSRLNSSDHSKIA